MYNRFLYPQLKPLTYILLHYSSISDLQVQIFYSVNPTGVGECVCAHQHRLWILTVICNYLFYRWNQSDLRCDAVQEWSFVAAQEARKDSSIQHVQDFAEICVRLFLTNTFLLPACCFLKIYKYVKELQFPQMLPFFPLLLSMNNNPVLLVKRFEWPLQCMMMCYTNKLSLTMNLSVNLSYRGFGVHCTYWTGWTEALEVPTGDAELCSVHDGMIVPRILWI